MDADTVYAIVAAVCGVVVPVVARAVSRYYAVKADTEEGRALAETLGRVATTAARKTEQVFVSRLTAGEWTEENKKRARAIATGTALGLLDEPAIKAARKRWGSDEAIRAAIEAAIEAHIREESEADLNSHGRFRDAD